jgi:hypothetical protein
MPAGVAKVPKRKRKRQSGNPGRGNGGLGERLRDGAEEACGVIIDVWPGWMLLSWVGGPGWGPRRRWLAYLTKLVRGSEGHGGAKVRTSE